MRHTSYRASLMIFLMLVSAFLSGSLSAQDEVAIVPDVTGLTVPQAAAELNRAGLRLGTQSAQQWTAASVYPAGTIGAQGTVPGERVPVGMAVDVSVLTTANVRLIYDDNDLTLINNTGGNLDLTQLVFSGTEGTRRFQASRWRGSIEPGDCTQVWSISRFEPKAVDGCDESTYWLTTNDTTEHFWTQIASSGPFQVVQNGVVLATCEAAPPNSQASPLVCEFFITTGTFANPVTDYVVFSYTTDQFLAFNTSPHAWMPLDGTRIQIPGLELRVGDPVLFGSPDIVADLRRLAPGQCSMLVRSGVGETAPIENCDLIARAEVAQAAAFWTVPFEILAVTRPDERRSCPAATAGQTTVCVMPR